jgi:4-amino-4-deoxy-L-arabinose transferase-like glycosyltransferase
VFARAILVRGIVAPFIFVDEVIWSELARGIADAGKPLLRDQPDPGYSVGYPLLISPAYALCDGLPNAYAAVKAENALLMSLAAVPAFFLARRVTRDGLALLAAVLTVAVPSLAYTGTVMTENAFYPLFLLVVLVLVVVLERPTAPWVILLLVLAGVAYATRVQAYMFLLAILLFAPAGDLRAARTRSTISRFRWLYGLVVGLAVAVLVGCPRTHAAGSARRLFTGRRSEHDLSDALRYLWWHVAELALYVVVIRSPRRSCCGTRSHADTRLQAFSRQQWLWRLHRPDGGRVRVEFSPASRSETCSTWRCSCALPLAWVELGAPRPRLFATIAAVVSALLVVAILFDRFLTTSAITDTLMPPALVAAGSNRRELGSYRRSGFAAVLAAAFLFVPGRYASPSAARSRSGFSR